jgi:hypothetical protein
MLSISIPPKISFKPALLTDNRSNVIIYLDISIQSLFVNYWWGGRVWWRLLEFSDAYVLKPAPPNLWNRIHVYSLA